MIKNQANIYQFVLTDQLGQGITGLTPSVKIRKDNGSFATAANTPSAVDATNAPGLYSITFTATECDCDVMTIQVSLPDGQTPAIIDIVTMAIAGGATAQEVWEYANGRTVTNTIPSASDNATAVWDAQTKVVTIDSTQAETLATASALSTVSDNVSAVKAKTDKLPNEPAAVGSAMTLTQEYDAAKTASQFDPSTTAVVINAEQADTMLTATGFATPSDITSAVSTLSGLLNKVLSGMYHWVVENDQLVIYDSVGEVDEIFMLSKDALGNIIAVTPYGEDPA